MRRRPHNQSSAAIMLRSLTKLIAVVTVALGLAIILAVGHQLLAQVRTTTAHISQSLRQADIDGNDDWETWRRNSTLDTSQTYVYVHNMRKDAKVTQYLSPNADDVLEVDPVKVPLIAHLYYRPKIGFLYHRMVHAKGIYYTLWQNMAPQLAVLTLVVQVTVVLLVLTLVLTPFYIRRLTKRLTDPLTALSQTTQAIARAQEPGDLQLPVPKRPTEVTELAGNFNALLHQLAEREAQQKLFVMNAAHELRTPIATIRSHAQLIERHGVAHPEIVAKSVGYITEESRQMEQLIAELLQLSRADRLALDLGDLDLTATVAATVQKLVGTIAQPIATDLTPGLHTQGNAQALDQILVNLLTNAAKYSPKDCPITVTLSPNAAGEPVVAVKDGGIGIDSADKAHVFERFYRSADVRGTVAGTGLGLAIAAQLAKLTHATLAVADNQPRGTVFFLTLPKG
ncbi:HAMP domain-containing sensor histidine kinase [Lacticaseibacillus parakribbianus]|uniref:HAMP domain-containing sensor histidine kinase n=1 Tax=Lacticaseibacillus parakribbianus TaxID=2970927 RepID=UPI0021CB4556|nr:HAMP domain-containing sensor histidine kinase [Lacticaseibacillus parakribbianus]